MIRRIVDAVNLMEDLEPSDVQTVNLSCTVNDLITPEQPSRDEHVLFASTELQADTATLSSEHRGSPSTSSSFSLPSLPDSPEQGSSKRSNFFNPSGWEGLLTSAESYYAPPISIAQQPKDKSDNCHTNTSETQYLPRIHLAKPETDSEPYSDDSTDDEAEGRATRSPSPPRFIRRQSPSPGVSPQSPASRGRQLPGEKLFAQQAQKRKEQEQKPTKPQCPPEPSKSSQPLICKHEVPTNQPVEEPVQTKKTVGSMAVGTCLDTASCSDVGIGGTSCQMDPVLMTIECMLLPFVRDLNELELRIPATRLTKVHRRVLKSLAAEYELVILAATKGGSADQSELVVRKRASLIQRQQAELELKKQREAEERARRLALEEQNRLRLLLEAEAKATTTTRHQNSCCQANLDEPQTKPEVESGRKKYRRLRNQRRKLTKTKPPPAKPKMVDSSMQTVPEDHWLCPWCLQHIPPTAQCGHEAICRAGVKQKQKELEAKARLQQRNADAELRRRQRLGLNPLPKEKHKLQKVPIPAPAVSGRSRSRTRLEIREKKLKNKSLTRLRSSSRNDPQRKTTAVVKLDEVPPNDLGAMARLMQRLCREPQCKQLADAGEPGARPGKVKCPNCRLIYCARHRPIGMHTMCPATESETAATGNVCSTACGLDLEEKRAALKSAIRQRREVLMERRQRQY